MEYLLLICTDGTSSDEQKTVVEEQVDAWIENTTASGARQYGSALKGLETAKTVRSRNGETLVSDGPFVESKEYVAGFDLIEAADLDEAIAIAAAHPMSRFHAIEVRPFMEMPANPDDSPCTIDAGKLPPAERLDKVPAGKQRYMLFMCANGIAESDEEEAQVVRDAYRWSEEVSGRGMQIVGTPVGHPDTATTVRVRDGETLLSDGPFTEAKEFMAGFTVLDCASEQEAIEFAARHPLAGYHRVEVRPFSTETAG